MAEMQDYELRAFFGYIVGVLERLDIPYMVVGGFATIVYGEPRLTLDVDVVVDMKVEHVRPFVSAFPESHYYVSEESVRDSLLRSYPFNVIESATAAKVDLVPLSADLFTRMAFRRKGRLAYDAEGHTACFIKPEDVVVAKLLAHKATESEKHLRDARGVLIVQGRDLDLVRQTARVVGVADLFEVVLRTAQRAAPGGSEDDRAG